MHLGPKLNRTQMFWVEILRRLRGWHIERKRAHVRYVGGRLEVWPWEFVWTFGILHNQEWFDLKQKRFHRRFVPQPLCVQLSHLLLSLTLPIRTFWVIKRKKKKHVAFVYFHVVVFFYYTTLLINSILIYKTLCSEVKHSYLPS